MTLNINKMMLYANIINKVIKLNTLNTVDVHICKPLIYIHLIVHKCS